LRPQTPPPLNKPGSGHRNIEPPPACPMAYIYILYVNDGFTNNNIIIIYNIIHIYIWKVGELSFAIVLDRIALFCILLILFVGCYTGIPVHRLSWL